MTDLPKIALPSSSVELGGQRVTYHSLSRSQALRLHEFQGREDEAEDFMLACGTDVTMKQAHAWRDSVDLATAGQLIDAIIEISGLTDTVPKEAERPLKAVK